MPDRDPEAPQNARLLTVLIWAGVGLAPVAALIVLLGGSDNSIRFAVLLVAVCVVLIGAALLIRNDPVLLKMDVEDQVGALREELREEIIASGRASGQRVKALQDEMTRMRAAGSPATALSAAAPPAAGVRPAGGSAPVSAGRPEAGHTTSGWVAAPAMVERGLTTGGRASTAVPSGPAAVQAHSGGRVHGASREPAPVPAGRPSVATASVAPAAGHTSVARIPGGVAAAVPVAVAAASVGPPATVYGAAGSASAAAAVVPRPRGAAVVPPVSGDGYQGEYATGGPRAVSDYGPGLSGSAWAERSAPVVYGAAANGGHGTAESGAPAPQRQSRRHAAPDTGTDIARFGLDAPGEGFRAGYGLPGGYDQTGDASWDGGSDYGDGYADAAAQDQPATGGFGSGTSGFFAQEQSGGFVPDNGYPQPDESSQAAAYGYAQGAGYGQPAGYEQADDYSQATSYGEEHADGYGLAESDGQGYADGYGEAQSNGQAASHGQANGFGQAASHGQANGYGQAAGHAQANGQAASHSQANGYGQAASHGQANGYGQAASHGQANGYGQAAGHAQANGQPGQYGRATGQEYAGSYDQADSYDQGNDYGQPSDYSQGAGRADQYGPDPMAAQHGWAPRSHERQVRW